MIDFLNSKSSPELRTMQVEDITKLVLEINKMVQKKLYRKITEAKLGEIKEKATKEKLDTFAHSSGAVAQILTTNFSSEGDKISKEKR